MSSILKFILVILFFNTLPPIMVAQKTRHYFTFPTQNKDIYDIYLTNNGEKIAIPDNRTIKLFSLKNNNLITEFKNGHNNKILSIDISEDSTYLVSGGKDSTVVLWDFQQQKITKKIKCKGIITSVSLSPDSHYLAFGGTDQNLNIYDINNDKIIFEEQKISKQGITSIKFSPSGNYIAVSEENGNIYIYDKNMLVATLSEGDKWVRDFAFNTEGTRLITCGDNGKTIIWDISNLDSPKIIDKEKHFFSWLLSVDYKDNIYAVGSFNGNIDISIPFGNYRYKIKSPINKIRFVPNTGIYIKLAIATRNNGVILLDAKDMHFKKNKNQ